MKNALPQLEGLRERKRRETLQRIADAGLKLFLAKGFEATTVGEIAAAAGISRRTFFYYFDSKDDILLARLTGYVDAVRTAIIESSSDGTPLDIAYAALLQFSNRLHQPQAIAIARLIRNSRVLHARARGQAGFQQFEQAVQAGLCELWPAKSRRDEMRLVAIVSIGAMRLAVDAWLQQDGKRPLAKHLGESFKILKAMVPTAR